MNNRVAVVVLAYSRYEILKSLIRALHGQTRKPDEIIVINQGNSPEIFRWLNAQEGLVIIQQENKGSAGGFSRGIVESIKRGHGWTWIFDDDAIPQPTALEELITRPYFGKAETAFLGSRIINKHGNTYMSPGNSNSQEWYGTILQDKCIEAIDACWLGLLINNQIVQKVGLPIEEFFLWDEDREFVSRLIKKGKGYCAITSVIVHYQNEQFDPFGKDFYKSAYYVRNHIARSKIGSSSILIKTYRVFKSTLFFLLKIARRELPFRTVFWIFRGIFLFWPKVKFYNSVNNK